MRGFVRKPRKHEPRPTRLTNPDRNPSVAAQNEVRTYGEIIIRHKGRTERVSTAQEQDITNALIKAVTALRQWKGRKLPYTLGALDVWLAMYLIDRYGIGQLAFTREAIDNIVAWFAK